MNGEEQKLSVVTKKFKDAKCEELFCSKCPFGKWPTPDGTYCRIDKGYATFGELSKCFTKEILESEVEAIEEK